MRVAIRPERFRRYAARSTISPIALGSASGPAEGLQCSLASSEMGDQFGRP